MKRKKKDLKEYIVTARIRSASGYQRFIVKDASSEEAAIDAFRNGEGEFDSEEISVDAFGDVSAEVNE